MDRRWKVEFYSDFVPEFRALSREVKRHLAAQVEFLETLGPLLSRPFADTLKGTKYSNRKELRFDADGGVWRVAFIFDPERNAILLVAGDKSGTSEDRFYRNLIRTAEERYARRLIALRTRKENR
jgi:hypothetical protein